MNSSTSQTTIAKEVLETTNDLPVCPCCSALAFKVSWRDTFDLQHACDCILERPTAYEDGIQQLWEIELRRREYLSSLPVRYQACTFKTLERYADNAAAFDVGMSLELGQMLYLWGKPGNGKTHLACAIGFRLIDQARVRFWNMASLYAALRDAIAHDQPRPNLLAPSVLILDDLGKVKTSEFVYETLYACLEGRWSNGKTTILTANHKPGIVADRLTPSSLDQDAANAILSRLVAGRVLEVRGSDRREGKS